MSTNLRNVCAPDEEALSLARKLTDLLRGTGALLVGAPTINAVQLARGVMLECRAAAEQLLDRLEQVVAVQAEAKRHQAQVDHVQAAKHVGQERR